MKAFYYSLLFGLYSFIIKFPVHGQGTDPTLTATSVRCGNNSPQEDKDKCRQVGTCSFDPYSGNVYREVQDLEVWGGVGEMPLVWKRYGNSRFGFFNNPYGNAHFWTSSF